MLMGSALRAYAPENDEGSEPDEIDEIETGDDLEDEIDEDVDPDIEDGAELDDEGDVEEPVKQSRAENRVAAATRTAAEAKRRVEDLERELATERQSKNQVSQQEHQRRRDEHLATLTGDQRTEFLLNEMRFQQKQETDRIRFESYDAQDKAAFAAIAAKSPAIRGLEAEVEERLALLRKDGGNIAREAVAKFLLGEKAMAKATRANNVGSKRAAAGRERSVTRPTSGRGDVAATRSRQGTGKLEDRLRDVKI